MAIIVPGILTDDEEDYRKRLEMAEHVCGIVQIDLVDGKFSPNKTVGVETIKKYLSSVDLEIQLMVVSPLPYIDELGKLNFVSRVIFPFESDGDIFEGIYRIKKFGKHASISLNPDTEIAEAIKFFDDIDMLLLMTGKPGYSGQKLGEDTYSRIAQVRAISKSLPLEIDIGVNFENAAKLAKAGANFLVTSSAIYGAADFTVAYEKMSKLVR